MREHKTVTGGNWDLYSGHYVELESSKEKKESGRDEKRTKPKDFTCKPNSGK